MSKGRDPHDLPTLVVHPPGFVIRRAHVEFGLPREDGHRLPVAVQVPAPRTLDASGRQPVDGRCCGAVRLAPGPEQPRRRGMYRRVRHVPMECDDLRGKLRSASLGEGFDAEASQGQQDAVCVEASASKAQPVDQGRRIASERAHAIDEIGIESEGRYFGGGAARPRRPGRAGAGRWRCWRSMRRSGPADRPGTSR